MLIRLTTMAAALLAASLSFAQSIDTANVPIWIEMMQDPNANFFETQRAFNLYWEGRERQPGDGWKVFKRWENHMSMRVLPDGSFPSPDATRDAFETWLIQYNQQMEGIESINGEWVEIGPIAKPNNGTGQPNGNGRLNAICFHPTNAQSIWVGAPSGGLWHTTDGGTTWSSNTDAMPTLGVSSILINPVDTNIMYIGTGDRDAGDAAGLGVYKSTDGGQSWSVSNTGMGNRTVGAMAMHPDNPSHLLAATNAGIYRSLNAGLSWTLESISSNFKDIVYRPGSSNVIYATETSSPAGFWRSTDGGDTWTEVTTGLPSNGQRYVIGVSPADTNTVYILCSISSAYGGLFKSTNGGTSFATMSTTPNLLGYAENGSSSGGQGWYDLGIAVDPLNAAIVYVGGVNIWKSTNSGQTWDCAAHWVGSSTAAAVHADQHWLAYSPVNGNLYVCNDGGLYYTSNGGQTWPELSSGLGLAQIYKIGVSSLTNELVINGYQDNGTAIWDDTLFRTERGGDGMECLIDYSDDNYMYATVYYGNINRSTNRGYSFGSFAAQNTNGITEEGAWVTPFILDKDDPNIMFIGYKNVWRTTTAKASTLTFSAISNSLGGTNSQNMRQLRQSKVNGNRLFALRGDNKLFRSDNALSATPTWTDLTSTLPGSGTIYDIETSATDNNTVWITRGSQVYKSTNGGSSWTNITGNLPSVNKRCLVTDPLSDGSLYVGADAGVYHLDNNLSNWVFFGTDLPATVEVTELEIYHEEGDWEASRLRAGTYGRGLWESDLYNPGTYAPMAFMDISLDSTDVCGTDTIDLINNSAYGVSSTHWVITPSSGFSFVNSTSATSMNAQVVFTGAGSYDVRLVVSNSNGSDSVEVQDAIVVSEGISLPFEDDFEDNVLCAATGCETSCLVNAWRNIPNGDGDDIDWRPDSEGTPWSVSNYNGANTGPSVDYNPGSSSGVYLYVSSYPPYTTCYNLVAELHSPCISLENVTSPEFKFAYHRFGNNGSFGDLDVDVLSNGSWSNEWSQSGNQGDQWLVDSIDLSAYEGETVKLRFVGFSGSGWQADMAIDGIEMTAAPLTDFAAADTQLCNGAQTMFSDLSTQNPTSWSWTVTPLTHSYVGGTNAQSQNPVVQFNAPGTYTVSLNASNAYGSDLVVKTAYVTVVEPAITLSTNHSNNTFCEEDTVILTVQESYPSYQFYLNGNLVQSGALSLHSFGTLTAQDVLHVEVTDSMGCTNESANLQISLYPVPEPVLAASDEDLSICDGDTVTFDISGTSAVTNTFYQNGTVEQSGASASWTALTIADQDAFSGSVIDANGCHGNTDTLVISVLPLPATPSIQSVLDSLHCSIPAQIYRWSHDGSLEDTPNNPYPQQGLGEYRVRIFDGSCWSLWSDPFYLTGFEELNHFDMKVYPSPAVDQIVIEWGQLAAFKQASLRILDMQGRVVMGPETVAQGTTASSLDISHLSTGVYHIVLQIDGHDYAVPIAKERR